MTIFGLTPLQAIPIILLAISLAYNTLSKIFDLFWKQHSRNLNEILDVDKKLDHKNKRVGELVELHQARFLIQQEKLRAYKQLIYVGSVGWLREVPYVVLKALAFLSWLVGVIILYVILIHDKKNILLGFISFYILVTISFWVIVKICALLNKYLFRGTKSFSTYTVRLNSKPNAFGQISKVAEFKVRMPTEKEGYEVFDYIGRPNWNEIVIYKKVNNKTKPDQPVLYTYEYRRAMTMLEIEWAAKLNLISRFYRRSSPYIPYLKPQPEKGITYSGYYLLEK